MGKRRETLFPIREYVVIPADRVGALIGEEGRVKKTLEQRVSVKLEIESSGAVTITGEPGLDPLTILKLKDVIKAIGLGFSAEHSYELFEDENILDTIELTGFAAGSRQGVSRVKGRLIGEGGKTRRMMEETTSTHISIYGENVSIIGDYEHSQVARKAIEMIAEGQQHSTVTRFLQRERGALKKKELVLWRGGQLKPAEDMAEGEDE